MPRTVPALVFLLAALLAVTAPAQTPDRMGIFFDTPFVSEHTNNDNLYTITTAYLVVLNPSVAQICGYEAGFTLDPSVIVAGVSGDYGWTNFGTNTNHFVGYSTPFPSDPCETVLATFQLLPTSVDPSEIVLGPTDAPSVPGYPAILGGPDCNEIVPCTLTSGEMPPGVVATFHGYGVLVEPCDTGYNGPIWYVSTTGSDATGDGSYGNPFATLSRAVTAASPGHTISMFNGTYSGSLNRNVDLAGQDLAITSYSGNPADCVIELGGQDGVSYHAPSPTTTTGPTFHGITWRNGDTALDIHGYELEGDLTSVAIHTCRFEDNGRGVFLEAIDATVIGCRFTGNTSSGLYISYGASVVEASHFEDNNTGAIFSGPQFGWESTEFINCDFLLNVDGFKGYLDYDWIGFDRCRFESNTNRGLYLLFSDPGEATVTDCDMHDNGGDGVRVDWYVDLTMTGCDITGNAGNGFTNAVWQQCVLNDVVIADNDGWGIGATGESDLGWTFSLHACEIVDNVTGGVDAYAQTHAFSTCLVAGNGDDGLLCKPSSWGGTTSVTLANSTLADNIGNGLTAELDTADIDNCIFASNDGASAVFDPSTTLDFDCTDIHGNTGGDWTGFPQFNNTAGNFAADPLFCDPAAGDYYLLDTSPCAPGNHPYGYSCGLIGLLPVGCYAPPVITGIDDVPVDQGLQVRLIWDAAYFDQPGVDLPVVGYGVYRWAGQRNREALKSADGRILGWDYLDTVPARGDAGYQFVAPTLVDSTAAGPGWSYFFVSAMTDDPFTYYDSAPDTGYSVDNIVPPPPPLFAVAYGPQNTLSWEAADAPDLAWYDIHRGDHADFPPTDANRVAQIQGLEWTDHGGTWGVHYKLVAVDDAGNESEPMVPTTLSGAVDEVPRITALVGNHPNPFNPATTLVYTLAAREAVTLGIYDLAGREVRRLLDGEAQDAGRYEAVWRGEDQAGRSVAAGTYVARLRTSQGVQTGKMVLVR